LENIEEIAMQQKIWESFIFPKGHHVGMQQFHNPMIFFVITGSVCFKRNDTEETHTVFSHEMFMVQSDNSFEIILLEQTHLIICHVPSESWFAEQKWIEELIPDNNNVAEEIFKLTLNKVIIHYLYLLNLYIKGEFHSQHFFELKLQELFFLLLHYYPKSYLAQFLQHIILKDMQFKKLVTANYLQAKNVQELAKSVNYSTSGFIKKFRRCFNESPYRWMQKQKAKQISVEIHHGIKSLQEIANEYKFSSYQHFSVFCKVQLGAPPTVILENNRIKKQ